jgi:RHS repeat-associated protein/uncharacterized repeat protein (TIGR01451 family)
MVPILRPREFSTLIKDGNPRKIRAQKPRVELLERRTLLASFTWAGGSSGDFGIAINWTDGDGNPGVPGIHDTATIGGSVTLGVSSINAVSSLNAPQATLNVTAGEISVGVSGDSGSYSSIGTVNVSPGATFGVAGGSAGIDSSGGSIAGGINVAAGADLTISSAGAATNINSGATFTGAGQVYLTGYFNNVSVNADITGPQNLAMDAGTLSVAGTFTIPGSFAWNGGVITGSGVTQIAQGATVTMAGNANKVLESHTIRNAGNVVLGSGVFGFESTGSFDNLSGATFDIQVDTTIAQSTSSGGMFTNESGATLKKSSGTGAATFLGLWFTNSGTVDVQSGALYFDGGGTGSGTFQAHAGTGVYFSGGTTYTLDHGATLTGSGQFGCVDDFSALTVNTDLSVENFVLSADHSSGLSGAGTVTVTHDLSWWSGEIEDHVIVTQAATFELEGTVAKVLQGGTMDNAAAATYSGSNLTLKGAFNNTGTFDDAADNDFQGGGTFNNLAGATFTKSAGTGYSYFYPVVFNNAGTVNVESGSIYLDSGGTGTGTFQADAGAGLYFNAGGYYTLNHGATLAGPGQFGCVGDFSALTVNTDLSVENFVLSADHSPGLSGTGVVTVTHDLDWQSGTISSHVVVESGATFELAGTISKTLSGGLIDNAGAATYSGTNLTLGGTFNNTGSFDDPANNQINGRGTFNNLAGATLTTSGAGSVTSLSPALTNTGVISVQGGTLQVIGGSFTSNGGTIVVAQGAVLDLTGGQTVTYAGTFTGSGQGTVALADGTLNVGLGGATFNFPGAMFQWTGGSMELSAGDVTNLGTINLSGSEETQIYADGTLYDYGTIVQTGTGNFGLHSDNITPTTLKIEPGGSYLLESDAGINNLFYTNVIDNAGTIKKTGGSGTSTLAVNGQLINTGTIEADSGTLALAPTSFAQITGGVLTGGTWNALDGSTITFPSGTEITGNAASIMLGGSGATISGIAGLASNSGSISLANGAGFTTTGDFSNSGSLSVGAGSTFDVSGGFTQTSSGTLDAGIGGPPAGGLYGQVVASGMATLGGALNVTLVNGYSPTLGQTYPIMSFASATGSFATVTGLPSGMAVTQTATALNLAIEPNGVDLLPTSVTAPTSAMGGQSITVAWQVQDQSPIAVTGSWQDSVYLSATPAITSGSILLGSAVHAGGLADNASYDGSLTTALPALAPGNWYVLVDVDSHFQVADINRANNTLAATTGQLDVSVPALTLGAPHHDSFTSANQDRYYQVIVPAGGSLEIALSSAAASGAVALFVSQGTEPTPYSFQEQAATANQPSQTVTVPQVLSAGTYYVLAHSVSGSAATTGYTITATQSSAMAVSAISPSSGGNAGNVTVEIDGTNFTASTAANLKLGSHTIAASAIDFVSASQLFATFNLTGMAAGSYTLSVQQGAQSAVSVAPFHVTAASPGSLSIMLSTPQFVRAGRTGTIVITYSNPTADDMVAPLLTISSTNTNVFFSTFDDPNNYVQEAQIMAVAPNGPAGILRPAQSGQLTLTILSEDTIDNDTIPVQVYQIEAGQTINWNAQESTLQPSTVSTAAWNAIWSNLMAMVGTTTDAYNAALAQAATYLSNLGETSAEVSNVGRLWAFLESQADAVYPPAVLDSAVDASLSSPSNLSFAIDRAFSLSISSRYNQGIFGPGWTTTWQMSVSTDAFGNVTIDSGGATGYFFKLPNGSYLDIAGEYGTLTDSGGSYTFTDTAGTRYVFLSSGQLNYEQDTNGNRITLGYNAQNQLVALTYSNPSDPSPQSEHLTLAYQKGAVSQIADGTGDIWTYNYDATGHLQSVIAPGNLTTSYAYDTSTSSEIVGALLSVTYPDGSQANFAYDAQGRLSSISSNGGANPINFGYLGEAEVAVTDAAGHQAVVWFNDLGQAVRVEDPLGGFSNYLYDPNGNLAGYTDAAGNNYQYAYDGNGNLTQIVDPLSQTVRMTYGSLSNLTSIADAANNTTQYGYDAAGNLLSITYPDGTKQSFSYDPLGNMSQTVEQNGDPVSFQYNAQGLVMQETFADKTSESFAYDLHGNLVTAKTFDAQGTLTGTTTLTYNAANELLSIAYPNGQYLDFSYNPATGQRTQSVDQDGFTVSYSYDTLGRLSELKDGSGSRIVQYSYNDLGQLAGKLNGNGTSTVYAYDRASDLQSIVNYAPDGKTVNSSFTYTYNLLGEVTSMTDAADQRTSYGYDATGQLTQVTLPGGESITYVYNPAGDRTEVITGGTTTQYSSNAVNEITKVGSAVYTYDANGNLHTVTDPSGTTTYTFNDLNQLVSITAPDGTKTTFQYNPLGFLVGENVGGTQTNYLVDPTGIGNVVGSYDGSGSLIAHYTYGLGLVSQTGPRGTGYYDFDLTGNTIGITASSRSYVNQYGYLPFGETTTVSAIMANPFTFAGQMGVIQVGTDLFSMRSRSYAPVTGQFLSNDPLGLDGGDTHLRRYVWNEPTGFVDPEGLKGGSAQRGIPWLDILDKLIGGDGNSGDSFAGKGNFSAWGRSNGSWGFGLNYTFGQKGLPAPGKLKPAPTPGKAKPAPSPRNGPKYSKGGRPAKQPSKGKGRPPRACKRSPKPQPAAAAGLMPDDGTHTGCGCVGSQLLGIGVQALDGAPPAGGCDGVPSMARYGGSLPNQESNDPNALIGPAGYGTPGFVRLGGTWPFTVDFENDGTAAAQDVTVTQQVDPNLDWSTFELGSFGFGPVNVSVPPGLTQYQTTVAYQNPDGSSLNVQVALDFNVQTGLLTITFTSLDPLTGLAPAGVFDGFLPPDDKNGIGEGYVQYTIRPKDGLATGTTITQQASVVFDINPPITTNAAVNTIDTTAPTSSMAALPATETSPSFTLHWSGSDGKGSGIASYDIFVSDNGGPFAQVLTGTNLTSTTFAGQVGHTYGFYCVATDNVGFIEAAPNHAQATTKVVQPSPPLVTLKGARLVTNKLHQVTEILVTFSGPVNLTEADLTGTYRLATAGAGGSFVAKNAGIIKLKSADYTAKTQTVALSLRKPMALTKPAQLLVYGTGRAGLRDSLGRLIDGDHNGRPGGNASVILTGGSAHVNDAIGMPTRFSQLSDPVVIDEVVGNGRFTKWNRRIRRAT